MKFIMIISLLGVLVSSCSSRLIPIEEISIQNTVISSVRVDLNREMPVVSVTVINNSKEYLGTLEDNWLDKSYSSFFESVECFDDNNKKVKCWFDKNSDLKSDSVYKKVQYRVMVNHKDFKPKYGEDEVPHRWGEALFLTGRAILLIAPKDAVNHFVRFEGIAENQLSTHWGISKELAGFYHAGSYRAVGDAHLYIGKQHQSVYRVNNTSLVVAGSTQVPEKVITKIIDSLFESFKYFSTTFGALESQSLLLIFELSPFENEAGGGTMGNSIISALLPSEIEKGDIAEMTWVPAHELFHHWNSERAIFRPNQKMKWFTEGFTEYYTLKAMAKLTACNDKDRYVKEKLAYFSHRYLSQAQDSNFLNASIKDREFSSLNYGGGALIALIFDYYIRKYSKNKKSLDDLMKALAQINSVPSLKGWSYSDLEQQLLRFTDKLTSEKLMNYIRTDEKIALDDFLKKIGLNLQRTTVVKKSKKRMKTELVATGASTDVSYMDIMGLSI